jgi:hypothetical protein
MAAVTVLAKSAKVPVPDAFDGSVKVKRFYFHIASVANGGTALDQNSIVRLVKLPAGAEILDMHIRHGAGGGTNTVSIRRCATSDGTTHTDIHTAHDISSAGFFRLISETAAAETCPVHLAVESWIDLEFTGSSGWPVDIAIEGSVIYTMPTFDDERAVVDGTVTDDTGVV